LELLDHETGNRAKGNLGRGWLIGSEEFLELLLREIVREVGNHDLVLGRNTISRRATLTSLTGLTRFTRFTRFTRSTVGLSLNILLGGNLVGGIGQGKDLASSRNLSAFLATRTSASTTTTCSTTASAATATSRWSTATTFTSRETLTSACSSLTLLAGWFRLASKLDRDLAFKNFLARELRDGTLSLAWGGKVDESVSNWAVGTGVLGNRGRFD
jgi:hypothetical protein